MKRVWALPGLLFVLCAGTGYAQELPSKSYDLAFSKGVHALNEGHYEEAVADFREALNAKPQDAAATYRLGLALRSLGRYPAALETLKAAAGRDPSLQPVHLDLGATMVHLDQYEEAREELLRAESIEAPSGNRQAMTQYYLGLTYQKQKRYKEAAPRFLRAAALSPELEANARYFAGVAFYRQDLFDESRDELERVVQLGNSETLVASAGDLLNKMKTGGPEPKRLSLKLSLGGQYDSNVILLPDGSSLPSGISNKSDLRMVGTFQAGLGLFRAARWDGAAGYRFYQSLHQDLDKFNVQSHDLDFTLSHHPSPRPYRIDFLYRFSDVRVDQENYLRTHTAGVTFGVSKNPSGLTQLEYRYQNRDFIESANFPGNEDRTGINHSVGLSRYRFFAEQKGNVHGGYTYDRDITRADDWDYQGHRLNLGVTLPSFWVKPSLDAEVTLRDYENPNSLSAKTPPEKRKDVIQIYTLTVSRAFTPWLSASAQYLYNINASNIKAFDYDRQIASVFMTASY